MISWDVVTKPPKSMSAAVMLTTALLLLNTRDVVIVKMPSPSLSESALIESGLALRATKLFKTTIPTPEFNVSAPFATILPVVLSSVISVDAIIVRPSVNVTSLCASFLLSSS